MLTINPNYMFERYVNFEFYKTTSESGLTYEEFEGYVNFEFYKTVPHYQIQ